MCAISTGSTRLWRRGTWSQSCRRFQAAKDGGSNHSHHWHKEGCVCRGCREAEAQLRSARAVRPGHPRIRDADRHARNTAPLCFERSEEHTSELQSRRDLVCRLLLEKKKTTT